jgi:hypothetical protein
MYSLDPSAYIRPDRSPLLGTSRTPRDTNRLNVKRSPSSLQTGNSSGN